MQLRAQNAGLVKASDVNMKMAAMRKQVKAEMVTISATLWSNAQYGSKSRKVCGVRMLVAQSMVLIANSDGSLACIFEHERNLQVGTERSFSADSHGLESENIVG